MTLVWWFHAAWRAETCHAPGRAVLCRANHGLCQSRAVPGRAVPNRHVPELAVPCRAIPRRAVRRRAVPCQTTPCQRVRAVPEHP